MPLTFKTTRPGGAGGPGRFIAVWLPGRPHTTPRAYASEVQRVIAAVGQPWAQATLEALAQGPGLKAIKSRFSLAQRSGRPKVNPAAARALRDGNP